jgi:hypothetical protein
MNKGFLFFFLLLLIGPIEGFAQMKKAPPKPEVMPVFPGGQENMYKYIYSVIKYPAKKQKKFRTVVEFMVDEKECYLIFLCSRGLVRVAMKKQCV